MDNFNDTASCSYSKGDGEYIYIINEGGGTDRNESTNETRKNKEKEWTEGETKLLLDKYSEYLPEVGPMKKFRLKKDMWEAISKDVMKEFDHYRSPSMVENRYKTILRRKKHAIDNNHTSGAKRQKVEYEEELGKISAIDDTLEPDVLIDQDSIIRKEGRLPLKVQNKNTLSYLKQYHNERKKEREEYYNKKEENKNKRHAEKMSLLKSILDKM